MKNRLIYTRGRSSALELMSCLQSVFSAELLHPSKVLYLISPWISDSPILSNHLAQFRVLLPEEVSATIGLRRILLELDRRGVAVRIVCRPDEQVNRDFAHLLPNTILVRYSELLHVKGLLTQHFYLRGSMNFTFSGTRINEESVELSNEQHIISQARIEFDNFWEDLSNG